ncbi:MAG: hypothetical protein EA349_03850, partial [Halomonadaceae bacterium]
MLGTHPTLTFNTTDVVVNNNSFWHQPLPSLNPGLRAQALEKQNNLTKPPGALGQLESVAVELACQQGRENPAVDRVQISLFAADHGVCDEAISAFPQS